MIAVMPPATGYALFLAGLIAGCLLGASWMHRVHELEQQERDRRLERVLRERR